MPKFMNQLQRVLADTLMLLLLFGILIIPISSVNLLRYENGESGVGNRDSEPLMQVLSKQDVRGDAVEATESSQATESTPSTIKIQ